MSENKTQTLQPNEATEEKTKRQIEGELLNEYLREHKIKLIPGIDFPNYKKLPAEVELAMLIINKHEPQFAVEVMLEDEVTDAKV